MIVSTQTLHHHMTENDLNYFFGVDNHLQGRKTGLILAKVLDSSRPLFLHGFVFLITKYPLLEMFSGVVWFAFFLMIF